MEQRKYSFFPHGRVGYPVFDFPGCDAVNRFYETLRDAVRDYTEELQRQADGTPFFYSADYETQTMGETLLVRYTLRLRRSGTRTVEKTWMQRWENGYLLPGTKEKKPRLLRRIPKSDIIPVTKNHTESK